MWAISRNLKAVNTIFPYFFLNNVPLTYSLQSVRELWIVSLHFFKHLHLSSFQIEMSLEMRHTYVFNLVYDKILESFVKY